MKIIYSPEYDGHNHLPLTSDLPCLLNTTYVGNAGLLAQLQLRMGLSAPACSDVEREADYLCALIQHKAGTFYEKAAEYDVMGTAHQLLQWRDALVMAGWTPEIKIASDKLKALAAVEQDFHTKGMADHWRDIAAYTRQYGMDCAELNIQVEIDQQYLPQLIRQTLLALKEQGAEVSFLSETIADNDILKKILKDKEVKILEFHDVYESYEWFANNDHATDTVVINQNTDMLNHVLASWDKPLSQAKTTNGNPQITQLFKLGLSLFEHPLNVRNLIAYLEIPLHPIPSKLRHQLAFALCSEGGIYHKWKKALDEYKFDDEDEAKNAKKQQKLSVFWNMIENTSVNIAKESVLKFSQSLQKWSMDQWHNPKTVPATRQQLNTLISFCKTFDKLIENIQELSSEKLSQILRGIYRPSGYTQQEVQRNGFTALTDIGLLATPTDHLIWLDCINRPAPTDTYDFLYTNEREMLKAEGVQIPDYVAQFQLQRQTLLRTLTRIKKTLTVVIPVYEGNEKTNEHPFVSELKAIYGKDFEKLKVEPKFKTQPLELPIQVRQPQETYELRTGIHLPEREQSYSSLDKLVQFPFDYVTEYMAHLREPSCSELKDINSSKGLAAHLFIEELVKEGKNNLKEIRKCFEEQYEERIERAIRQAGSVLLLKENQIEKVNFIVLLRRSADTLLSIWEKLELTPVGCEVEVPVNDFYGCGSFMARIDCLLKNKKGEYVIFDFKWSNSVGYYPEKIKQGQDMQLQLYKWAIEHTKGEYKGRVAATGYYLFPICQFFTGYFNDVQEDCIKHIEINSPDAITLVDQIHHSIDFRKAQLKEGVIEEAEEMLIRDLCYGQKTEEKGLYPLNITYGDKKIVDKNKHHKVSPYAPSTLKKNTQTLSILETPTPHAALKSRLK